MMKHIILYLLVIFFCVNAVFAQGGSNYSIFGLGDINHFGNASYEGLAGVSIAMPSTTAINYRNPALWSLVTTTRLQTGYKFNQNIVEGNESSLLQNNGGISGFTGIFAIDTGMGISASFGLVPFSNVNYLIATPFEVSIGDIKQKGTTIYQGAGGISTGYLGVSTGIGYGIYAGVSANANFGIIKNLITSEFEDPTYSHRFSNYKEDYVNFFTINSGIYYNGITNLGIGLYYSTSSNIDVETKEVYDSPFLLDTSYTYNSVYSYPSSIGIGISYLSGKFLFGADFSTQDFSNFQFNKGKNTELKNSTTAAFGVNRIGNPSLNADFMDRISYKLGLGYKELYYKVLANEINEYYASFGMAIPWKGTLQTDLSFTFGYRGTLNDGLVKEYFGKFGIDISIGETWFIPFKREY